MSKQHPVPSDFVTIYHPAAGEAQVAPRSVKHWEGSGWSTTKPKPAPADQDAATADVVDEPALTDEKAASSEPPAKAGRRAGRNSSASSTSSSDVSVEAPTTPETPTE